MNLPTLNEAIAKVSGERKHLLVGNGFSEAWNHETFESVFDIHHHIHNKDYTGLKFRLGRKLSLLTNCVPNTQA